MEKSVKFSVMVPVYKVEAYLAQCIESVLGQSYTNFELILVDDGSPDRCGAICDDYAAKDGRIRVIHKENGGLMSARRAALEHVSGDYCVFLDSDDYIAANTLELLAVNIEKYKADCIIYGIYWMKPGGTEHVLCHEAYVNRLITDKNEALNIILNDHAYNSLCRKCVRASCFDGRDFSPYFGISSGEDRMQSTEILENAESFLFIPEALYYYRVNASSVTHTISYDGYKADFTVAETVLDTLEHIALFSDEDYDRLRNSELDILVIELKRISRFCSDRGNMLRAFSAIRAKSYYKNFLSKGYRPVSSVPGVRQSGGLRRLLNRIMAALLGMKLDGLIIFICRYIYK